MYYNVGQAGNSYFIYDDSDDSCELIDADKLQGFNIISGSMNYRHNIEKIAVVYHFKRVNNIFDKRLAAYEFIVKNKSGFRYKESIEIGVSLVKLEDFVFGVESDYIKSMIIDGYVILTHMKLVQSVRLGTRRSTTSTVNNSGVGYDVTFEVSGFSFYVKDSRGSNHKYYTWGTVIPVQMLSSIMKFVSSHDLEGMLNAFNGIFHRKLTFSATEKFDVLKLSYFGELNVVEWF